MLRLSPVGAIVVCGLLVGCDALDTPLLEPTTASRVILDGRDAGTPYAGSGVFLLPPISDNDFTRTGPFDPNTDPRVEICHLPIDGPPTVEKIEAAECGDVVAWFETDAAHDGTTFVTVDPLAEQYAVGWNTNTADANKAFRVSILLPNLSVVGGDITIGYKAAAVFDAVLYDNASTKLDAERVVGYNAGQNFPVKFIVEEGSACDGLDCFAYRVTCEAAVYQTEHAGVRMPEDWADECDLAVPGPERTWWLFQERLPAGSPCVPSSLVDGIQYEPCYVWQLVDEIDTGSATTFEPYVSEFREAVLVQYCNNAEAAGGIPDALIPLTAGYRYSTPPGEVVRLEESDVQALGSYTCPYEPEATQQGALGLSWLTQEFVRPALRLLGMEPRPLYAGDRNTLTDRTVRTSDFQRILEFQLDATSAASFSAITGSTSELAVRLITEPHHEPLDGPSAGVPGIVLQFHVVSGDADLSGDGTSPCLDGATVIPDCVLVTTSPNDIGTPTDEGGFASVLVTLGGTEGAVVVEVSVPADPDMEPLSFSIQAVQLELVFLEPLETGDFYGPPEEAFAPTVYICASDAVACTAQTAAAVIPAGNIKLVSDQTGRKFYQADWKPRDHPGTPRGGPYYVQVLVGETTVGYSIPIYVTKGGKGELVGDVYYNGESSSLAIKFTLTRP